MRKDKIVNSDNWKEFYVSRNIEGSFLLKKLDSDSIMIFNENRAINPYLPASTFKILNSLISLETGVISDEYAIIKWDGKKRFYDKWNQDQNLRSAFKYSCVWFYQELARRIGRDRMEKFIRKSNYGNCKTGKEIDTFWLEGDLRISSIGQMIFLSKFIKEELPFSENNFKTVKSIMLSDSSENYKLYSKAGWAGRGEEEIGWFVGFINTNNEIWIFVNNIKIDNESDAEYRKEITFDILKTAGLIK